MGQYYSRNSWFHIWTEGNMTIFRSPEDHLFMMNRIAALSLKMKDIVILAFVILDSHFHLVVSCSEDQLAELIQFFKVVVKLHFKSSYKICIEKESFNVRYRELITPEEKSIAVSYTLWNPVHHRVCSSPFSYPYSSIGCYFKDCFVAREPITNSVVNKECEQFGSIKCKSNLEKELVGKNIAIPDNWLIYGKKLICQSNYVAVRPVEVLYNDSFRNFFYEVTKCAKMPSGASSLEMNVAPDQPFPRINDMAVCAVIDESVKFYGKQNFLSFSDKEYLSIIADLRRRQVSKAQIIRCLWLTEDRYNKLTTLNIPLRC